MKPQMQDSSILYRSAVGSDTYQLGKLIKEYCEENGFSYDDIGIRWYLDYQLGKVPCIVAVDKDDIVGVISYIVITSLFNSKEKVGKKMACFVTKEYRNKDIGRTLLDKAEKACKEKKVAKFYFSSTKQPEGYEPFETEYYKGL